MKQTTFLGNPVTLLGEAVSVGNTAKDFTALAKDLSPVNLYSFADKIKVLTIFPSLDTSVCATQVRKFNEELGSIHENVVVLAISNDLPFAQNRFCSTEGLNHVVTLSDYKDTDFGLKYGFLIKELRLLTRGVVIIDSNNIIQYVEYVPEVTNEVDFEGAIQAVKKLI